MRSKKYYKPLVNILASVSLATLLGIFVTRCDNYNPTIKTNSNAINIQIRTENYRYIYSLIESGKYNEAKLQIKELSAWDRKNLDNILKSNSENSKLYKDVKKDIVKEINNIDKFISTP